MNNHLENLKIIAGNLGLDVFEKLEFYMVNDSSEGLYWVLKDRFTDFKFKASEIKLLKGVEDPIFAAEIILFNSIITSGGKREFLEFSLTRYLTEEGGKRGFQVLSEEDCFFWEILGDVENRKNGPAYIFKSRLRKYFEWISLDLTHRDDGPAVIQYNHDGTINYKRWVFYEYYFKKQRVWLREVLKVRMRDFQR